MYRIGDVWHLQIGRERWPLGDRRLRFEARPRGMRTTLLVDTPTGSYKCVDFSPLSWFLSKNDPTYDAIDAEADDFPGWLAGLRKHAGVG